MIKAFLSLFAPKMASGSSCESISGLFARFLASAVIWVSATFMVALSSLLLRFSADGAIAVLGLVVSAAAVSTAFIWLSGRRGDIEARQKKIREMERRIASLEERVIAAETVQAFEERLAEKAAARLSVE